MKTCITIITLFLLCITLSYGNTFAFNEALHDELIIMKNNVQQLRNAHVAQQTPQIFEQIQDLNKKNTLRLKEIMQQYGWPDTTMVGDEGSHAAFILAHHADHDSKFQEEVLTFLHQQVLEKNIQQEEFALLQDRILVNFDKEQLYGTQCNVINGNVVFKPIKDPSNIDNRRAKLKLPSISKYQEFVKQCYRNK